MPKEWMVETGARFEVGGGLEDAGAFFWGEFLASLGRLPSRVPLTPALSPWGGEGALGEALFEAFAEAELQLACRLFCEGDGDYAVEGGAAGADQGEDAFDEYRGLAGSGARFEEEGRVEVTRDAVADRLVCGGAGGHAEPHELAGPALVRCCASLASAAIALRWGWRLNLRRGQLKTTESRSLDQAIARLRRNPTRPVRAEIDGLTVEVRRVEPAPRGVESAAEAFASLGQWEGESPEEIRAILTEARREGGASTRVISTC